MGERPCYALKIAQGQGRKESRRWREEGRKKDGLTMPLQARSYRTKTCQE
jgi:hypothetical protein